MNNIIFKECVCNADAAFLNSQFDTALEWYQTALLERSDDLHCLSRAGAICVMLKRFDQALQHFEKAVSVDPANGDNYFNLGNAYFFCGQYAQALKQYVLAEQKGCSEDVLPRMYYQYGLLCSIRQDPKGALVQFEKCEKADREGVMGLNPDLISEKLKIYLQLQDYTNAEQAAAQLTMIAPGEYKYYAVYSSILMAHKKCEKAIQVCEDAEKYAELTDKERFALLFQKAAIYADAGAENKDYYQKGYDLLNAWLESNPHADKEQKNQVLATLAELCSKMGVFDKGIELAKQALGETNRQPALKTDEVKTLKVSVESDETWDEDVELMLQSDMELIQGKIDTGELDEDMGAYAEENYDEEGKLVRDYAGAFSALTELNVDETDNAEAAEESQDETEQTQEQQADALKESEKEKLYFVLINCYLGKDDFLQAYNEAGRLITSSDTYFSYYGRYVEALTYRKICKDTQKVSYKYARTIAFFRTQYMRNVSDPLPNIFRARMYAESGEFAKAKELAAIMSEEEQKNVLDYIEQCRNIEA